MSNIELNSWVTFQNHIIYIIWFYIMVYKHLRLFAYKPSIIRRVRNYNITCKIYQKVLQAWIAKKKMNKLCLLVLSSHHASLLNYIPVKSHKCHQVLASKHTIGPTFKQCNRPKTVTSILWDQWLNMNWFSSGLIQVSWLNKQVTIKPLLTKDLTLTLTSQSCPIPSSSWWHEHSVIMLLVLQLPLVSSTNSKQLH